MNNPPCIEVKDGYRLGFFHAVPSSVVYSFDFNQQTYQADVANSLQVGDTISVDDLTLPYKISMQMVLDIGRYDCIFRAQSVTFKHISLFGIKGLGVEQA